MVAFVIFSDVCEGIKGALMLCCLFRDFRENLSGSISGLSLSLAGAFLGLHLLNFVATLGLPFSCLEDDVYNGRSTLDLEFY